MSLYSSIYVEMAEAKVAEGDVRGAEVHYRKALTENPDDFQALLGYGSLLAARPDGYVSAEKLLQRACEINPRASKPRIVLAQLYHTMGRAVQARAEIAEAERIDPTNPE